MIVFNLFEQMRWVVKPEFRGVYHMSAAVCNLECDYHFDCM